MADIPELRSKEQIAGDIIDGILARLRKDIDLNQGSVLTQLIEAIAQNMFKSSADIISMIDANSIDRAEGEALQRLARDKQVPIFPATSSTGLVTITDTSFERKSSRVYSGQPAPVAGSLKLYVSDASSFTSTNGSVYVGRGTTNVEGPLNYTSVQAEAGGAYWSITLASTSPTTKFHNVGEEVVLAQGGNRIINAGSSIKTAQGFSTTSVDFKTTSAVTIIDGEVLVTNVPVKCEQPGTVGNVPRGAIKEATGIPYPVTVFNDNPFSNGREADTDDDIRARIKAYEQAKGKGTASAMEYYSNGVMAPDELKKVASAKVIEYSDSTSALIFDDGTGYEPNFIGSSYEIVVDEAIGGETEAQMRQKPIAQARLISSNKSPYSMEVVRAISVTINNEQTTHYFSPSEFRVPNSATAFEIAASINGDSNINFNAGTANAGTNLILYPRNKSANSIQVASFTAGSDANDIFGFPKSETLTLRLYKNDLPLHQDGYDARLFTKLKSEWLSGIASGDTLSYIVDGTTEITATFTTADFQKINQQATVSSTTDLDIWVQVFNAKLPGVIATIVGEKIALYSARGISNEASLELTGGTLLGQIFDLNGDLYATGKESDFTLNRQTGQIGFTEALLPKDKITAGSQYARGNVTSSNISAGPGSNGRIWAVVDGDVQTITNGINPNAQVNFSKSSTTLTISSTGAFGQVQNNDWVIVWANSTDDSNFIKLQGFWRVQSCSLGSISVDDGPEVRSNATVTINPNRIVILRTEAPVQELDFTAGPLIDFIAQAKAQLIGVDVDIIGAKVRFATSTLDESGEIYIAAADEGGQTLNLPKNIAIKNIPSHYGFVAETDSEVGFPSFTHGTLGAEVTSSQITESSYELNGGHRDEFIEVLPKYDLTTKTDIAESNKNRRVFVSNFDPALNRLYLVPPAYMNLDTVPTAYNTALPDNPHRSLLQQNDRYILRSAYSFDSNDTSVVIADGDAEVKTYTLPVARKIMVSNNSTPSQHDFSATDIESSLDMSNPASFYDFNFNDFKVFRQANVLLADDSYEIKVKSADFGPAGNKLRVGFVYPESVAKTELSHHYLATESLDAEIALPVKDVRTPNWNYTTSFTVSKTTFQGKDTLTFTYGDGAGTEPDFASAGIQAGDVVFIGNTNFLPQNRNIKALVTNVTPKSFTIELPTGAYTSDAMTFTSIENVKGTVTFTTATPHNLTSGQRIGLFNTAVSSGTTQPLTGSYMVKEIISDCVFSVNVDNLGIGADIKNAVQGSNLATIETKTDHNLSVGNIIKISDAGGYTGVYPIYSVVNSKKFTFIKTSDPGNVNQGRVDFQSTAPQDPAISITSLSKTATTVTVTTTSAHGLATNDIVKISGINIANWTATTYNINDLVKYSVDGLYYLCKYNSTPADKSPGYAVPGWEQVVAGTAWDSNNTYSKGDVTLYNNIYYYSILDTNKGHIPSGSPTYWSEVLAWNNTTIYGVKDVCIYSGNFYRSLVASNLDTLPGSNFVYWNQTSIDLTGSFVVTVTSNNVFTYTYPLTGNASATGGTANKFAAQGALARAVGGQVAENLQFASIEATAQQVVDYISVNMSAKISASVANGNPTAVIKKSTEDKLISSYYLYSNITKLRTVANSRLIKFTVPSYNDLPPKGSDIAVSGITGDNAIYNGLYTVMDSYFDTSLSEKIIEMQSPYIAKNSSTIALPSAIISGTARLLMMGDGENSVKITNLAATVANPMFQVKRQWVTSPEIGEEIRLVAVTSDHLVRLWNKLVVTGLSNVANINLSQYGRQLQISTKQFGSTGSIQIAGGTSNKLEVAVVGSGKNIENKLGNIQIPFDIKKGFMPNQWITLSNNVRENKRIGLTSQTTMSLYSDGYIDINADQAKYTPNWRPITVDSTTVFTVAKYGSFMSFTRTSGLSPKLVTAGVQEGDWVQIEDTFSAANIGTYQIIKVSGEDVFWIKNENGIAETVTLASEDSMYINFGAGSFSLPRMITSDLTSVFKIEKHGNFMAFIRIDGTSLNLFTAGVKEGDWVQIKNTDATAWSNSTIYSAGDRVSYAGENYTSLSSSNQGHQPDISPSNWQLKCFSKANVGTYQVVRTFGEDTFWVKNDSGVEEIVSMGSNDDIAVYSYDSVIPGDVLVISADIFGDKNQARYKVLGPNSNKPFPTDKRIYIAPINSATTITTSIGKKLSEKYIGVNIEEQSPIQLFKRIFAIGPASESYASILTDSPELIDRISSSLGAGIVASGKIGFNEDINFGIDAYKNYIGLIKELNKIIYGDSVDPIKYPGVRAAGTDVDIKEAIVRRITAAFSVRVKTGIPFSEIRDNVKAAVAGYVNSLGVGESVSISRMIAAAGNITGVVSVAVTYPTYSASNDLIPVSSFEKAYIVDPTADITVSAINT